MSHCNLSDSSTKRMILQMEPYQYYTKVCTFFSLNSCFLSYFQGLRGIWSQPDLIPGFPVPHFLSPWTNGPQKFSPSGQMVPKQFGPPGQMVQADQTDWGPFVHRDCNCLLLWTKGLQTDILPRSRVGDRHSPCHAMMSSEVRAASIRKN